MAARTAFYAPAHRIANKTALGNVSQGPDLAPSLDYGLNGLLDHRVPYNSLGANGCVVGWFMEAPLVDAVPSTLTTTAIAAAQVPVAGTNMTLVSSTGAGITVLASSMQALGSGNTIAAGSLAIDGAPGYQKFGTNSITTFYDPATALCRNIQIASVGNDSGGTFTVAGADFYGYPMTETITGANAGTATGKKAFKFVYSVTPGGTLSGANASVGQGDKYGLPIRAPSAGYIFGVWNAIAITGAGTFTAPDTTSPATATTGDVRGTYLVGSASNATKRLTMYVRPYIGAMQANMTTGLFGVAQV